MFWVCMLFDPFIVGRYLYGINKYNRYKIECNFY